MGLWLYQMSDAYYQKQDYLRTVWEGQEITWPMNHKVSKGRNPAVGDSVILFYASSGAGPGVAGLCGIGVVLSHGATNFRFMPINPSNFLKNHPICDAPMKTLMKQARGGKVFVGTMWKVKSDLAKQILKRIFE